MAAPVSDLKTLAQRLDGWMRQSALPLWWEKGADHHEGGYHELLNLDGTPHASPRRMRVQPRQSYAYAAAGMMGWSGPWREAALHGLAYLDRRYRREDGQYATLVSADGAMLDETATLYDQAFVMMARAAVFKAMPERTALKAEALALMNRTIELRRHSAGGFRESGPRPFLSNPHMHLFEAALAWVEAAPAPVWNAVADAIAELALERFIAPGSGILHEVFDADWKAVGDAGGPGFEPGHQFEWAWLLERWSRLRGRTEAHAAALRLFTHGRRGVDRARAVAQDEMNADFTPRRAAARLWPQTEWLKAALILGETAEAEAAARALWRYLETPLAGLWRDRMEPDGGFVVEPAPASSFYHIVCAIQACQPLL